MNSSLQLKRKKLVSLKKFRESNTLGKDEIMECPECHEKMARGILAMKNFICPECGYYYKVSAKERIAMICDEGSFKEMDGNLVTKNPIKFPGYRKKLEL